MIKMIIADDEILTLEMMACIIDWTKLGIEIAGTAADGQAALELVRRENPEILLTDIQMPHMDGIELLKAVSQSHPHMKSIILSAYGEFHYAKEAIRLGASGFLVKPIDEDELEELIAETVDSLRACKIAKKETSFQKLLSGKGGKSELLGMLEREGVRPYLDYRAFVIQTDPASDNDQLLYQDKERSNSGRIVQTLTRYMEAQGIRGYCFGHQDEEWVCIAERTEGFGQVIAELLGTDPGWKVVVGTSAPKTDMDELHEAYEEALNCLGYRFLFSSERVFEYDQLTPFGSPDSEAYRRVYPRMQALLDEIAANPLGGTDWRGRLHAVLHEALLRPDEIYALVFGMLIRHRTRNWEQAWNGQEAIVPVTYEALKQCKTLDTLLDYLELSLRQSTEEEKQDAGGSNELIRNAKAYIQAHYNAQISLEAICGHIAVSRNYFSSLFKKETGMNIWDYLTFVRMEHAKKLLTGTAMKNYEIALKIGYENPSYFTKMFKKSFGMLPQEYRIRSADNETVISG